ncbi:aspartyl-tRNA synthetase [Coniella lustricola]|uniref:Aspartyl-tRNA synthetase n=1 Tax=Coniella lustricola TaxID=2025994 RepID=A0A2T3A9T9_9PEZI|nr:aspartyl-tRNA synthetase [Coniella lustricola]
MTLPVIRGLPRTGRSLQRQCALHATHARALARLGAQFRATGSGVSQQRSLHQTAAASEQAKGSSKSLSPEALKKYFVFEGQSAATDFEEGQTITVHGFISKRRDMSKNMAFVDLLVDGGPSFQFKSSWDEAGSPEHEVHQLLKTLPAWSPVALTGSIETSSTASAGAVFGPSFPQDRDDYKVTLQSAQLLNPFPRDIIVSDGALFPPKLRHLQLRFDKLLQERLKFRDQLTAKAQDYLREVGFLHVETPVLFKSTPEGAREFLVPTRRSEYAYALPQSPQQYKQILMASGVRNYFQFARCFRDEDLRADRQPEFTQLDLEMSFATGENVMQLVESLVRRVYGYIRSNWRMCEMNGELGVTASTPGDGDGSRTAGRYPSLRPEDPANEDEPFQRLTYNEAMSLYGSDKPDLRIPNKIQRIDHLLPASFTSMISDLENPIVEACVFRFQDCADTAIPEFVKAAWDNLPKPLLKNPHGQPAPLIINSTKPLSGLSSLGHEAASQLLDPSSPDDLPNLPPLEEGDVLVLQARPNSPHSGGSTALGTLRNHIYHLAVEQKLLPFDPSFRFLWVTDFPLFTPTDDKSTDPGQGGAAGFSSTHHPFTAPRTPVDFDLLAVDPLKARADHYDLVVNGVELGGGSRRIHVAAMQEYIFRDVLKMNDSGIEHFSHLLEALRAGCPPHAGFAFGWDRLVATLSYTGSVRDVIAFPKSKKGDEPVARCPGKVTDEEWGVYHLRSKGKDL